MTENEEACSMLVIDFCRRHFRKLGAVEFVKIGARPEDIAIAAMQSAVDLAQHHTGDTVTAIAWARLALDTMEQQFTTQETVQ